MLSLLASALWAQQPAPEKLIPVRGVPFPVIQRSQPAQVQQPLDQKPLSQQAPALPTVATDAAKDKPVGPEPPVTPDQSGPGSTLLPVDQAARDASAVAASVVPPDRAQMDIPALAGEYSYGNGFDMNCTLEISADGRFLFKRCDCEEVVDQASGAIKLDAAGQVVLEPTQPRQSWPRGTAPVLVPVSWGQRLYLVPEDDMIGFVNQVNLGQEPVTRGSMGSYYLREGDWDRPALGAPDVPASWSSHILPKAIEGVVAGKDPANRWIIDRGQAHGIYNNMELTAWSPGRRQFIHLRVTDTGTDTSAVELLAAPPNLSVLGWNVYSRMTPPSDTTEAASK